MRSDYELLAGICARDGEMFEILYARYAARVRSRLVSIVHDAEATEDLVQEVFLRVWTRAEQWDDRGTCAGWLLRIATNLALNHLRAQRRKRELPLDAPIHPGMDGDDLPTPGWMIDTASLGPEACCEQADTMHRLSRMINDLPAEKREVLRLAHEAEMDIHEIAETLDIPEGTVKSRLHYARKRLAQAWEDE